MYTPKSLILSNSVDTALAWTATHITFRVIQYGAFCVYEVEMICRRCGADVEPRFEIVEQGMHYAKYSCPECDSFIRWAKKPENEKKRTRSSKYTAESLGKNHCEICRRTKEQLNRFESLHVHHKDGDYLTNDVPENLIVVCSGCHSHIHHLIALTETHLDSHITEMFTDKTMNEVNYKKVPF